MLSIEEAHRRVLTAVDEAVGWVPPKREAEHIERILAAHIAARDLALAGFRAGWRAGSGAPIDHAERDYGAIGDPGCMCRYHAKCREIKELS